MVGLTGDFQKAGDEGRGTEGLAVNEFLVAAPSDFGNRMNCLHPTSFSLPNLSTPCCLVSTVGSGKLFTGSRR